ncbi:MAG TPA: LamG-like jellyroll fold domain-containing protein [Stellaceae bacterium]|nr:LamG-like jellyroll fold domain-containing protein [Stellaceae bacterium]
MPFCTSTARSLAREFGPRIAERLREAGKEPAARAPSPWPRWSPDFFTIWLGTPKTAGTTLTEIVLPKFRGAIFNSMHGRGTNSALGVQRLSSIKELWDTVPPEKRRAFRFTGGHLPFGVRSIVERPNCCFTFLRDPIEHAISLFYFWVEIGLISPQQVNKPGGISLERAVDEGILLALFNYQTRLLSGLPELDPPFSRFPSKQQLEVPDNALTLAEHHLDDMFFVGITELFDESVLILKEIFGWEFADLLYVRQKVGTIRPRTAEMAPALRQRIAEITGVDRQLYQYARARFAAQAALYRRELHAYLPLFKLLCGLAGAAGSPDAPVPGDPETLRQAAEAAVERGLSTQPEPDFWPAAAPQAAASATRPTRPAVQSSPRVTGRLLDLVPGAVAAFGLRLLRWGHGDDAQGGILHLKLRNSDECYGSLAEGNLNLPAIAQFRDGAEALCVGWYDQSGSANNAHPITGWPAFEGHPADRAQWLRFRPPAQLRAPLTLDGLDAFSIFAVFRAASVAAARSVARWQSTGAAVVFPYHDGNVIIGVDGGVAGGLPLGVIPGAFAVYGAVWKRGVRDGFTTYRDGEIVARRASRDVSIGVDAAPLFIGSLKGVGEFFAGEIAELIVWPRALSDNEVSIVTDSMRDLMPAAPGDAPSARR